jgi:hypothetical protein
MEIFATSDFNDEDLNIKVNENFLNIFDFNNDPYDFSSNYCLESNKYLRLFPFI